MKTMVIRSDGGHDKAGAALINQEMQRNEVGKILWYSDMGHDLDVLGREVESLRRRLNAHEIVHKNIVDLERRIQEMEKAFYSWLSGAKK